MRSERQEWYDADPEPDPPTMRGFAWTTNQSPRNMGKAYAEVAAHLHIKMEGFTAAMKAGLKEVSEALGPIVQQSFPEDPRERALRLKQQPHSMTDKNGKFDSKGRCRY